MVTGRDDDGKATKTKEILYDCSKTFKKMYDFFKENLIQTKGLDSSSVISSKIYQRFGKKISSGIVRRYRRKFGNK